MPLSKPFYHLTWMIFLFYFPLLLLNSNRDLHQTALTIVALILYSMFLTVIFSKKQENDVQLQRFYRWLSKRENVQRFTYHSLATLKNALSSLGSIVTIVASIPIFLSLFSVTVWMAFIKALFACLWVYALITTIKHTYR